MLCKFCKYQLVFIPIQSFIFLLVKTKEAKGGKGSPKKSSKKMCKIAAYLL